jgi:hypothetical protein
VAEILALVAAFYFALAATLQQKGALGMGRGVARLAELAVVRQAAEGNDNAPANEWAVAVVAFSLIAAALLFAGGRGSVVRKAAL